MRHLKPFGDGKKNKITCQPIHEGAVLLNRICEREILRAADNGCSSGGKDWFFDQAPNVAGITTKQVIEEGLPVLSVNHYSEDHSWAFLCNTAGKTEDGRVIGMGQVLEMDHTLVGISQLKLGWIAERDVIGGEWRTYFSEDH